MSPDAPAGAASRALPRSAAPRPPAAGGPAFRLPGSMPGFPWAYAGFFLLAAAIGVSLVHLNPLLVVGGILGLPLVVYILTRPFLGLIVYTITFLIRPGELVPALENLHVERILGVVTILVVIVNNYKRTGRIFVDSTSQTKWLIGFWVASFCSIPMSFWPGLSVERAIDVLKIMMFYFMIVHIVDSRQRLRTLVWVYVLCIAYLGFSSIRGYYSGTLLFAQGIERVVGVNSTLDDPNKLGTTMAATFALLLPMWGATRQPAGRLMLLASVLVSAWGLGLTGSRSSTLGFLASMAALWARARHRFFVGVLGVAAIFAAFMLLPEQYRARYETIGSQHIDDSSQGRLDAWKAGAHMIVDRPFFGVGLGCFSVAHAKAYSGGDWLQPHNLYIQVPSEVGFVGAVAYFGFILHMFLLNRRTLRQLGRLRPDWKFERAVLEGMFAGLCGLLVAGMFGHSMLRETWYIYAALGLAVHRLHVDLPLRPAGLTANASTAGPGPAALPPLRVGSPRENAFRISTRLKP